MKGAEGNWAPEWCAVSILSSLFCAHSIDRQGFIKTAARTVSPRLPLSPWGPWWKKEDRPSLRLWQKAERSHIKLGRWDGKWGTYWMTAGPNDADGARSSVHTLRSRDMLVTKDTCDEASDEAALCFHAKCAVWESSLPQRWLKSFTESLNSY